MYGKIRWIFAEIGWSFDIGCLLLEGQENGHKYVLKKPDFKASQNIAQ